MDTQSHKTLKSVKSVNTNSDGGSPAKKQKKGMIVETTFAHAYDYDNAVDYLKAVVEKSVKQNDKHSFGAEIFRHVRKEYKGGLAAAFKT